MGFFNQIIFRPVSAKSSASTRPSSAKSTASNKSKKEDEEDVPEQTGGEIPGSVVDLQ